MRRPVHQLVAQKRSDGGSPARGTKVEANVEQPPVAGRLLPCRKGSVPTIDNFLPGLVGVPGLGFETTVALLPSLHCFAATSWRDKSSGYIIQNLHPSPFCFRLRGAPVFTELRRGKSARRADAASRRIVMSSHCPPTLSIPAGTPGMVSLLLVSFAVASRADNCSITNPPPPPVPFLKTGDASHAMGCHILSKP